MNKCHQLLNFRNHTTPAMNETNMNYMDGCIDTLDDRIIALDLTKADESDLLTALSGVSYNTTTGVFTFTWKNGTTASFDLNVEKIPVSFSMSPAGIITMTTEDGTSYTCDVSTVIKLYTFIDSTTIDFTVTQNGNNFNVTADIVDGSITEQKLRPDFLADCNAAKTAAQWAESDALQSAEEARVSSNEAEAWANGTQGGQPVPSSHPAFQNNALWWMQQAQAIAGNTLGGLTDVTQYNPQLGDSLMRNETNTGWENKPIFEQYEIALPPDEWTFDQATGLYWIAVFPNSSRAFSPTAPIFVSLPVGLNATPDALDFIADARLRPLGVTDSSTQEFPEGSLTLIAEEAVPETLSYLSITVTTTFTVPRAST